jgi:hypothetical protein
MKDDYLTLDQKIELLAELASKATKSLSLSESIQARYAETMEAVSSLPKAQKAQYVEMVKQLFFDRVKTYISASDALGEYLRLADEIPSFEIENHEANTAKIRGRHAEMLAELQSIQSKLEDLQTGGSNEV